MQYFNTLPRVVYTDENRVSKVYTNLLNRANLLENLKDPLLFYTYDIQDGDTPEIVAHKYYGNSYRYWIVLCCNNILNPQWDWPLSGKQLDDFITNKYKNGDPYNDVHHYERIITQYDSNTLTTTVNKVMIDQVTYDAGTSIEPPKTIQTTTGNVTITVENRIVTNFEYEYELNESKRSIKLLNKNYAYQFEEQMKSVMGA